ncbi:MAG: AAA domain-containing protein, partial [Endozoicomonadaceae bacterium]|nr:AAA domain-containing protein [Endozoicomonadaceae bacterium]
VSILKALVHEIGFRKKSKKSLAAHLEKAQSYIRLSESSINQPERKATETPIIKVEKLPQQQSLKRDIANSPEIHDTTLPDTQFIEDINKENVDNLSLSKPNYEKGFIRKASGTLNGLPQAWSPEIKNNFLIKGLENATTNSEKFICALGGLIWEIRRKAKFSKKIHLANGQREESHSGEYGYIYSFTYDGDEEFFEGARVDFQSDTGKTKGSIVSVLPGKLTTILISLDEDFGNLISKCFIIQDESALLESLQKRFEIETDTPVNKKIGPPVGMNCEIADLLLKGKTKKINVADFDKEDISDLNPGQKSFVQKAIRHSISFLWGPPGTGKTQTLGAILAYFYRQDERTLICSNTNKAVDQVLLKLCNHMIKNGKIADLEDGKIIRIGRISQAELDEKFRQYVTVDSIVERKGYELTKKINTLEEKKYKTDNIIAKYQPILDAFNTLERLKNKQADIIKDIDTTQSNIESSYRTQQKLEKKLEKLQRDKLNYDNKSFLGKILSGGINAIEAGITEKKAKKTATNNLLKSQTQNLENLLKSQSALKSRLNIARKTTEPHNLAETINALDKANKERTAIIRQIVDLEKQIKNLRQSILAQAIVIGTTLTKMFLSPSELGKFDNIVIDEASMGLLPAVYFTASQSKKRCIISGDFRQLPPIVQSNNKATIEILGSDIFAHSGMQKIFENKVECDYAGVLREQYRMDPKICDLISDIGYEGELFTSGDRKATSLVAPEHFEDSVIIIDTSSVYPFTDRDPFESTSNTVHALLARNIMRDFSNTNDSGNIGYCTPFRAQIRLIKKMSVGEPFAEKVSIGTIHTFQGDEKNTIIFDTVSSMGEKQYLHPNLAQETASKSNLLTVAVSRAQDRLIFIANLRYLDSKIPAMGYFRKILFAAQTNGTVIDAKEIIDLSPLEKELEKAKINIQELKLPTDALKSGLVNEDIFFPLLKADLNKAKKYIAIYSGFYTSNRVNDLLSVLKSKI